MGRWEIEHSGDRGSKYDITWVERALSELEKEMRES